MKGAWGIAKGGEGQSEGAPTGEEGGGGVVPAQNFLCRESCMDGSGSGWDWLNVSQEGFFFSEKKTSS